MTSSLRHVVIVGGGLAGMAAAVAAAEAGADVSLLERGDAPGGASAESAGWIWRYRDVATARTCAPHADPQIVQAIVDRLDDDIAWLEQHGGRRIAGSTGRALTVGLRVDPRQVIGALVDRLGEERVLVRSHVAAARPGRSGGVDLLVRRMRAGELVDEPDAWLAADAVVFCGGGYAADLARVATEASVPDEIRDEWVLRPRHGGTGSSMDAAITLGALRVPATGESLVRLVPRTEQPLTARDLVRFSELQLPDTILRTDHGRALERSPWDWSGAQVAWHLARTSGTGRLELSRAHLRSEVHAGSVEDVVRAAIAAGASTGRLDGGGIWIEVRAGITHTHCGLRVDADGRLQHLVAPRGLRRRQVARALPHAWAAGCDAAGSGLGGTASGLAQALVLGRRAGMRAATDT